MSDDILEDEDDKEDPFVEDPVKDPEDVEPVKDPEKKKDDDPFVVEDDDE